MLPQKFLSNSIDFLGDAAERERVVAMAKIQLDVLMQSCNCNPSADEPAVATFDPGRLDLSGIRPVKK